MILIPAYNPPPSLDTLVAALVELIRDKETPIVIVNDGSDEQKSQDMLNGLVQSATVTVSRHPYNLGKGGALKTGIGSASRIGVPFVVTAYADG